MAFDLAKPDTREVRWPRNDRGELLPPHRPVQTAYALEAFDGATGLYLDPGRLHFIAVIRRPLSEGEVWEGEFRQYRVTWNAAPSSWSSLPVSELPIAGAEGGRK